MSNKTNNDSFQPISESGLSVPSLVSISDLTDIIDRKLGQAFAITDSLTEADVVDENSHRISLQAVCDLIFDSKDLYELQRKKYQEELPTKQ